MEWSYFYLIEINSGYYLFDIENDVPLTYNVKVNVFQSYDETHDYFEDSDIRGSVRDVFFRD